MKCHRCGSVMVYEKFYGPHEHFLGCRCILCGEIIDQVILENRQTNTGRQNSGRRKECDT
jgi:ribosomal protein S27E